MKKIRILFNFLSAVALAVLAAGCASDVLDKENVAVGAGFKVINLGRDVAPEKFVAAVQEHNANIVGISALMPGCTDLSRIRFESSAKSMIHNGVMQYLGPPPGIPIRLSVCAPTA